MVEKNPRMSGVLSQNPVAGFERSHGAECDVLEVADGCGDEVQAGR